MPMILRKTPLKVYSNLKIGPFLSMMENPSSHDLPFEVFDDSSNDPCSSPGAYLPHSTPIKNCRRLRTPFESEIFITSDSEPEIGLNCRIPCHFEAIP